MNLANFPYPDKWPPYMNLHLLFLENRPMVIFIGSLDAYRNVDAWKELRKEFVSPDSSYETIIVFRNHETHYIVDQESTELLAFGPNYTASCAEGILVVRNTGGEIVATNNDVDCFHEAFFWNKDLVLREELSMFIVDNETCQIKQDDYGDIIDRAYIHEDKLIVKMWDDKTP